MAEVTRILSQIEAGDPAASEQLLPLVYEELRRLASAKLAQERPGQTLQATALVHEAYLRLVDVDQPPQWAGRAHFFAAAAEAMRRILVECARRRLSQKRGGDRVRLDLPLAHLASAQQSPESIVALDEALSQLESDDPVAGQVVKLRFFGGLDLSHIADSLGVSLRTVERNWTYARTWLRAALDGDADR